MRKPMMCRLVSRLSVITLGAVLLMLGGCTSTPSTTFYVLTPLPSADTAKPGAAAARGLVVGVGPVTLPTYLDRPQIVMRASRAKLNLGEFDQWAASLQTNVSSVLAENLAFLIPTDHIVVFPWPRSTTVDYQVMVDVARFDGEMGGEVILTARWRIVGTDGKERMMQNSRFSASAGAQNYEATVNAMSRMLEELSRDIAATIRIIAPQTSRR